VYQIRFPPGLRPEFRWGSLQRSPDLLADLRGALLLRGDDGKGSKGVREEKGRRGKGRRGRDKRKREGEGK